MPSRDLAVIAGVGPGLGAALARRFANGGMAVALIARRDKFIADLAQELRDQGHDAGAYAADVTDAEGVTRNCERIRNDRGRPTVMIYNAGTLQMGQTLDLSPRDFRRSWETNCYGGFLLAKALLPDMVQRGRGTAIFTGATAALRGSAGFSALAVGKFGLRALAQSLARELGPRGIHVAHVVIDGQINTPRVRGMFRDRSDDTFLSPEDIAEVYWQLHQQPATTWTHELDLRPATETF